MTYRHRKTGALLRLDWQTDSEVGLYGEGWTWTGTVRAFEREFTREEGDG